MQTYTAQTSIIDYSTL